MISSIAPATPRSPWKEKVTNFSPLPVYIRRTCLDTACLPGSTRDSVSCYYCTGQIGAASTLQTEEHRYYKGSISRKPLVYEKPCNTPPVEAYMAVPLPASHALLTNRYHTAVVVSKVDVGFRTKDCRPSGDPMFLIGYCTALSP